MGARATLQYSSTPTLHNSNLLPLALVLAVLLTVDLGLAYGGHETVDVATITADRVKQFLDVGEKVFLIDLRTAQEFKQRRIPGARSIPMADLHNRVHEIPRSGRVVLYSAQPQNEILDQVFQFLDEKGFRNVAMMVEGFQGWVKRKYPIESGQK